MSWDIEGFREKLETEHEFPGKYIFKFIIKTENVIEVEALWEHGQVIKKPSSKGNFTSVTIHGHMQSSDDVILVYQRASMIEGCIAL